MFVCAERRSNGKWYALYVKKSNSYPKVKISDELPTKNKELVLLRYERKANAQKTCNYYNYTRETDFHPVKVRKKNEEY